MAKTFDTSRVGGGTYELAKDANGNYNLNSVGFTQVNKLNLPDLKSSAATTDVAKTTKDATENTIKAQTTEVFTPSNIYQSGDGGGGRDNSIQPTVNEAKVNEATVRQAGETINTGKTTGKFLASGAAGGASLVKKNTSGFLPSGAAGGASLKPTVDSVTGVGRSESEKFKERFDPTKIQASAVKPSIIERATTGVTSAVNSIKNNKAIEFASTALGFVTKPVMTGLRMAAKVLPKDSPTDKFNRSYFPINSAEKGGRISGNPATNLYAGMNAVSQFGNVGKAGTKRIATREATIARKGYKAGDSFFDATQKMKNEQSNYQKNKGQGLEKDAKAKGLDTKNPNEMKNAGEGKGNGKTRVICTELHRTKDLSTIDWIRDTKFTFKTLSKTHVKGYLLWAEPTVKHMQKYPKYRKVWKHIAQHRANDIAWRLNEGKFDLLGRIYAGIGEPLCWALGNFVSDKQINKYNLTHWRRA